MEALMGVDLGQKNDPTAICVVEREPRPVNGRLEAHFHVRHLERLPIGARYAAVADRMMEVLGAARQQKANFSFLYVDVTGVGQPIVDFLESRRLGLPVTAVYLTDGDRRIEKAPHTIYLGKAYLVSRLQTLLQSERIQLPRTSEAEALAQELLDYEIRVDQEADECFGAFKVGIHDDLVTALGLTVQDDAGPRSKVITW